MQTSSITPHVNEQLQYDDDNGERIDPGCSSGDVVTSRYFEHTHVSGFDQILIDGGEKVIKDELINLSAFCQLCHITKFGDQCKKTKVFCDKWTDTLEKFDENVAIEFTNEQKEIISTFDKNTLFFQVAENRLKTWSNFATRLGSKYYKCLVPYAKKTYRGESGKPKPVTTRMFAQTLYYTYNPNEQPSFVTTSQERDVSTPSRDPGPSSSEVVVSTAVTDKGKSKVKGYNDQLNDILESLESLQKNVEFCKNGLYSLTVLAEQFTSKDFCELANLSQPHVAGLTENLKDFDPTINQRFHTDFWTYYNNKSKVKRFLFFVNTVTELNQWTSCKHDLGSSFPNKLIVYTKVKNFTRNGGRQTPVTSSTFANLFIRTCDGTVASNLKHKKLDISDQVVDGDLPTIATAVEHAERMHQSDFQSDVTRQRNAEFLNSLPPPNHRECPGFYIGFTRDGRFYKIGITKRFDVRNKDNHAEEFIIVILITFTQSEYRQTVETIVKRLWAEMKFTEHGSERIPKEFLHDLFQTTDDRTVCFTLASMVLHVFPQMITNIYVDPNDTYDSIPREIVQNFAVPTRLIEGLKTHKLNYEKTGKRKASTVVNDDVKRLKYEARLHESKDYDPEIRATEIDAEVRLCEARKAEKMIDIEVSQNNFLMQHYPEVYLALIKKREGL